MENVYLDEWAAAIKPWFEREMRWHGSFFNPPAAALAAVADRQDAKPWPAPLAPFVEDALLTPIRVRGELVMKYAWAIPSEEALETIARHSPNGVVEIGAGTGYWAGLLRARGVDVAAYDEAPYDNFQAGGQWSEVLVGGPLDALRHPERTLFLCWPPYDEPMATMALRRYKGAKVVYVGEWCGATADEDFHELLETEWERLEVVSLPQWAHMHDDLYVYERKSVRPPE